MHILMTGATGSIGQVLVFKLLEEGHRLTIVARNVQKAAANFAGKVVILKADIRDPAMLETVRGIDGLDALVHLAANLDYFGREKELFDVNVEGTINILNAAKQLSVKKFILVSSVEAMGLVRPEEMLADEDCCPRPVSSYGRSKLAAERVALAFSKGNGIDITVLRLGNVYGPRNPSFIVQLANAFMTHDTLYSFFPCYRKRYVHPVYITDAVDGIARAVASPAAGKIFIIAGEEYATLEHIMTMIARYLHVTVGPVSEAGAKERICLYMRNAARRLNRKADMLAYLTMGDDSRIHRAYSIERAKRELGFMPKVTLEYGIAKTLAWAREEGMLKG